MSPVLAKVRAVVSPRATEWKSDVACEGKVDDRAGAGVVEEPDVAGIAGVV